MSSFDNTQKTKSGKTIPGFVLSLVGLLCCGFLTGIPGLILSILAMKEINQEGYTEGKGLAMAGIILGALSIIMTIVGFVLTSLGVFADLANSFGNLSNFGF